MHTPEIKSIKNSLWEHFDSILKENWNKIFQDTKFHTSYIDGEKEVTLRFRVKEVLKDKIILEVEKEIRHITGESPVEKEVVEIII